LMWCFFLYQIFKPAEPLRGPGDQYRNLERDPNLDREFNPPCARPACAGFGRANAACAGSNE
jgi:hypothetical protein